MAGLEPFMSAIAIISLLVGAVLGRSLRVMVLVPAIAAGLALVTAIGLRTGATLGSTALAAVLVALGLQLGYVAGVLIRHLLAGAKVPRRHAGATAVARSGS
jgi:hypothetical protein